MRSPCIQGRTKVGTRQSVRCSESHIRQPAWRKMVDATVKPIGRSHHEVTQPNQPTGTVSLAVSLPLPRGICTWSLEKVLQYVARFVHQTEVHARCQKHGATWSSEESSPMADDGYEPGRSGRHPLVKEPSCREMCHGGSATRDRVVIVQSLNTTGLRLSFQSYAEMPRKR